LSSSTSCPARRGNENVTSSKTPGRSVLGSEVIFCSTALTNSR
jgi:hypothetical protein